MSFFFFAAGLLLSAILGHLLILIGVMPVSVRTKLQPTGTDPILNTLTDLVNGLGQTRAEMRQRFEKLEHKLDRHEQRFDQQDKRFDQQDKRFDQQDKRFDQFRQEVNQRFDRQDTRFDQIEQKIDRVTGEIKEMFQALLSR
ncbi:hypothetical protein [Endozoicomonas sp. 4G]|uniref:hypothetical protein n=1 Tax=Endozoicomonas sp. 4G TaxID=2872754 RepID=UPI0020788A58|nr:hypothetical protein [Endozoicomonas sp. 4G]